MHAPQACAVRTGCGGHAGARVSTWLCGGGQDDAAIILDQALLPLLKLIEAGGDKEKAAAVCFLGTIVEMRPAVAVRASSVRRVLPGRLSHSWHDHPLVCRAPRLRG